MNFPGAGAKSFLEVPLLLVVLLIATLLAACGGSGSGMGSPNMTSFNMGGSIQGSPLSLSGAVTTMAGVPRAVDGIGAAASFNNPQGITTDGPNLYVADTLNNTIRKIVISTGAVTTIAGTAYTGGHTDGIGTAAKLNSPSGITTDGLNIYVADTLNNTIRKIVISTGAVSTIAGRAGFFGAGDGVGPEAGFRHPTGIVTDGTNLYVADTRNNTIRKIVIDTGVVTTMAGAAGNTGLADGVGPTAKFKQPTGITTDGKNLYISDTGNGAIRQISISDGVVTTIAGIILPGGITTDGGNIYVSSGGNAIFKVVVSSRDVAQLGSPRGQSGIFSASSILNMGVITDGSALYIADTAGNIIRRMIISSGDDTPLAGTASAADGTGNVARFYQPRDIATNGTDLFVADYMNRSVRKINILTGAVTTIATPSRKLDSSGTLTGVGSPYAITTDGTDLYVAEGNRILKLEASTGSVSALAGDAMGRSGSDDGIGTAARFNHPTGITTDGPNLYVTDTVNNMIRKIVISTGVVSTIAGSAGNPGSDDGVGTAARFNQPTGITTDGTSLYVADTFNNTIRKIVISTGAISTMSGIFGPCGITTDGTNLYVTDSRQTVRKIDISSGAVITIAGAAGTRGAADGTGPAAIFNNPQGITTDGTHLYVTDDNMIRKIQ